MLPNLKKIRLRTAKRYVRDNVDKITKCRMKVRERAMQGLLSFSVEANEDRNAYISLALLGEFTFHRDLCTLVKGTVYHGICATVRKDAKARASEIVDALAEGDHWCPTFEWEYGERLAEEAFSKIGIKYAHVNGTVEFFPLELHQFEPLSVF